mmetsp:Transcript_21841/g.55583  ORF Transcript_21841/g.55583 Transcript_21841/m.55583 type:complete len:626 (-) Transcript_21841:675-2552(-)
MATALKNIDKRIEDSEQELASIDGDLADRDKLSQNQLQLLLRKKRTILTLLAELLDEKARILKQAQGAAGVQSSGAPPGAPGMQAGDAAAGKIKGLQASKEPDFYAPRQSFIDGIMDKLPVLKWMVMKAPPASGKTTALTQLARCGLERGYRNVYYFNAVEARQQRFTDGFQAVTGTPWVSVSSPPNSSSGVESQTGTLAGYDLILVDEAQLLYDVQTTQSEPLWDLLKSLEAGSKRVHVVLAAIWGTHPSHADGAGAAYPTPLAATPAQVIQLRPTVENPELCLALTWGHFMEQVSAWHTRFNIRLEAAGVLRHIFDITAGYVGVVTHLLAKIGHRVVWERRMNHQPVDVARAARYALASSDLWSALGELRSLMGDEEWYNSKSTMQELIDKAGPSGNCTFHDTYHRPCTARLQRLGYVHLDSSTGHVSFHSPLHYWYYLYKMGSSRLPTAAVTATNLHTVLGWAIERMSGSKLAASLTRSREGALLERAYQMEFYMALCNVLPNTFMVSPDVGTVLGSEGYVDFVIHGTNQHGDVVYYAVELLRDGLNAQEHAERFAEGGAYAPMLQSSTHGCVSEYALIDFRSRSSRPRRRRPNFIYACLNEACSGGTLFVGEEERVLRLLP